MPCNSSIEYALLTTTEAEHQQTMDFIYITDNTSMQPDIHTSTPQVNADSLYNIYFLHFPEMYWVCRIFRVLMYILGYPGNIVAGIIWLRSRMRHSSGCYLAVLAFSDLLFLFLDLFYHLQTSYDMQPLHFSVICEVYPVLYIGSQYMSPLFTLSFTVERYISIRFPFQRRVYCTTQRAIYIICSLVITSFLLSAMQGYFYSFEEEYGLCLQRADTQLLWTDWTWVTETLMFFVVPLLILIFNILVILEVRKARNAEKEFSTGKCSGHIVTSTTMLLAVSFYFIVTTLPVSIVHALADHFPVGSESAVFTGKFLEDHVWISHFRYMVIREIINSIGLTHYVFNFYIYICIGHRFRHEVKRMCNKKKNRSRNVE